MKTIYSIAFVLLLANPAAAYHNFFFRSADDITSGTLDSARLNPSSVTLQGNSINISTVASGHQALKDNVDISTALLTIRANSAEKVRFFDVTICTLGVVGCDIASNTEDGWNAALNLIQARGLTDSTTAFGTIRLVGWPFDYWGATVPRGVTMQGVSGSSVTFMPHVSTGTIITNYGTIQDITVDLSSAVGYTGHKFVLSTGSVTNNLFIKNGIPSRGGNINLILVSRSSNVTVNDLKLDRYSGTLDAIGVGTNAPIYIEGSTAVYFNRPVFMKLSRAQATDDTSGFGILNTSQLVIRDGIFQQIGGIFIQLDSNVRNAVIERNRFHLTAAGHAAIGYLGFRGNTSALSIASAAVTSNQFFHHPGASNIPIIGMVDETADSHGTWIAHNQFINLSGGTPTGVSIEAGHTNTFLLYNRYLGMGQGADSGTGTRRIE